MQGDRGEGASSRGKGAMSRFSLEQGIKGSETKHWDKEGKKMFVALGLFFFFPM